MCFESETIIYYCIPQSHSTWVRESKGGIGLAPLTITSNKYTNRLLDSHPGNFTLFDFEILVSKESFHQGAKMTPFNG